jgi:hypothetical protein
MRGFLLEHSGGKAVSDQAGQGVFERQVLVERMKGLREEVESEGDITRMLAPFPVLLAEVCETLGLRQDERDEVLGPAAAFVEKWRNS